ncbi:MAG TPA: glycosyltransferase, partial [Anaerolinea sp.]|nr:glycosyltransferase [Anaerolinea sp.]
ELNPPCPNAVIEALACGLPVVGFAAGSLPELLDTQSGRMSPWGGNIWKLQPPNRQGLAEAALEVLHDQPRFRAGARARAAGTDGREIPGRINRLTHSAGKISIACRTPENAP